jgi:hypothetical protein
MTRRARGQLRALLRPQVRVSRAVGASEVSSSFSSWNLCAIWHRVTNETAFQKKSNLASTSVLVLLVRSSTGSRVGNSIFAAAAAFRVSAAPDPDGRPEARRAPEAVAVKRLARAANRCGVGQHDQAQWAGCTASETVKRTTSSTAAAPLRIWLKRGPRRVDSGGSF